MFLIGSCTTQLPDSPSNAVTSTPQPPHTLTPTVKPSETATQTPTPVDKIFEGRIAIAGLSRQHSEIRLYDLKNGEIQDIPGLGFESISWSADYQWIAFIGGVSPSSHSTAIYVSRPDGSDLQKYADNIFWKTDLNWSPDGKFLVFTYDNRVDPSNLAVLNLTNGETYLLTSPPGFESNPAWSPDGKQIAYLYVRHGGLPNELWIMNADGSNPKRLIKLPFASSGIDWSPDGSWLAFVAEEVYAENFQSDCGNVYIIKPDGTDLTRLTDLSGCATNVTWSPDGKHLALVIKNIPDEMRCQIYIMDATGANLVAVGEEEELRIEDIDWGL